MRTRTRGGFLPVLLGFFLFAGGCEESGVPEEQDPEPRIPRVSTLTLEPSSWVESIGAHGVIEAAEEVNVTIDFSATVRSVHFQEGDRVETGKPIIEFDRGKRELRLTGVVTRVDEAKARLDQTGRVLERREALYRKNVIPREQYDEARTAWQSASARYQEALAAQRLARRELGETILLSPVSGRVAKRLVDPGETVMPGQLLSVIQTVDTVRVVTYVSEKDVNGLHVGAEAQVTTPGVRGRAYRGRIESVGIEADPRTGNFTVKLTVPNEDGLLRQGMTASVVLQGIEYPDALLVPESAVVDRNRRRVVYRVEDDRAVEVRPVLMAVTGERIPVLDGLDPGDVLIVGGLESVVDGSRVETIPSGEGE